MRLLYGSAVFEPRTRALKGRLEAFEDAHSRSRRRRACTCAAKSPCAPVDPAPPVAAAVFASEYAAPAGAPVLLGACGTPIGMGVSFPGPTWEKGKTRPIAVSCTTDLGGNWVVELGVKLGS